jgi:hypothetical protein
MFDKRRVETGRQFDLAIAVVTVLVAALSIRHVAPRH